MCYNGNYKGKRNREVKQILKDYLSPDCSLKLENMKLESLVIVDQHATVNLSLGLVHTARQGRGIGLIQNFFINFYFFLPR